MDAPKKTTVDHWDHDTLNNRKGNLKLGKGMEINGQNRNGAYSNSRTGIRGVSVHKCRPSGLLYCARVDVKGKKPYSKYFPHTDEGLAEAARTVEQMRQELMPHSRM